jgi:hypothetical protein
MLGRHEDQSSNNDSRAANGAGDEDEESHSLRKFLQMASSGEMLAIELLYVREPMITILDPIWHEVRALAPRIVTRDCLGFVGYCQRQAANYSIKGSRLTTARNTADFLHALLDKSDRATRLGEFATEIREFCTGRFHVAVETRSAGFSDKEFLVLCERKLPFTVSIGTAVDLADAVVRSYGRRADNAAGNNNVDLKATMHALRVAGQAVELLTTGRITFPRPDAEHLKAVRAGAFSRSQLADMLEAALVDIDKASVQSTLRTEADQNAIEDLIIHAHQSQLEAA